MTGFEYADSSFGTCFPLLPFAEPTLLLVSPTLGRPRSRFLAPLRNDTLVEMGVRKANALSKSALDYRFDFAAKFSS
jgi:hypothetical protein